MTLTDERVRNGENKHWPKSEFKSELLVEISRKEGYGIDEANFALGKKYWSNYGYKDLVNIYLDKR